MEDEGKVIKCYCVRVTKEKCTCLIFTGVCIQSRRHQHESNAGTTHTVHRVCWYPRAQFAVSASFSFIICFWNTQNTHCAQVGQTDYPWPHGRNNAFRCVRMEAIVSGEHICEVVVVSKDDTAKWVWNIWRLVNNHKDCITVQQQLHFPNHLKLLSLNHKMWSWFKKNDDRQTVQTLFYLVQQLTLPRSSSLN